MRLSRLVTRGSTRTPDLAAGEIAIGEQRSIVNAPALKAFRTLGLITVLGICINSPATAQTLNYFGYVYGGEMASDLAATHSYTNFAFTDGVYDPTGVYDQILMDRVRTMRSYNILAVINLGRVLWIENKPPGVCPNAPPNATWCLAPDYINRWALWTQNNQGVLNNDHVLAFDVIGEASLLGIPPRDVDTATKLVKTTFPSINTMLIEAGVCLLLTPQSDPKSDLYKRCTSEGTFPAGIFRNSHKADWVGLDHYRIHPTTDSNFKVEVAALKQQMHANQKMVYVMDASWDSAHAAQGIPLSDMAAITWEWYQVAAADPLAVTLGAFLWPSLPNPDPNANVIGSRDFPDDVHRAQVSVGQNIVWQQYEGYLDQADCNVLAGWAWDRYLPNEPIPVDIYANGALQPSGVGVSANQYRADLVAAGKGNGYHAFVWTVPQSLKNGATYSMVVKYGGTGRALGATPKSITCTPPSASIAWVKPAEVTWGPAGTLTVAGYAQNGTGGVTMYWRDATLNPSGLWNAVAYQPPPDASHVWYNTIPNSNNCHTYQVYAKYSGVTSGVFTYTGLNERTSGYCKEVARVIWMQPQSLAGFGPPGSIVLAGSATGAPSGTVIKLWSRDVTAGTGWSYQGAALPNGSGIWYGAIQGANASHVYSAYVTYDVITSATCTYAGNNAMNWCP